MGLDLLYEGINLLNDEIFRDIAVMILMFIIMATAALFVNGCSHHHKITDYTIKCNECVMDMNVSNSTAEVEQEF
jgi:hypothetical protein